MMMTEFAGIAFKGKSGWGYGESVNDNKEFIERLDCLVSTIKEMNFLQGYCITQLTDVQQETNGLLYEDRTPKVDFDIIKKILFLFRKTYKCFCCIAGDVLCNKN
mgnify:CR=1 FL=1